ncbi:Mfsd6 [Symbiodinium sp. CCMP2592]|nr:Mfsd6 [Symbiodinium sp. CCMP2592]
MAAETEDETAEYEEGGEDDELKADTGDREAGLDELLETEAEALAAELEQQAEQEGCDEQVLGNLEDSYGSAAEALVSMREARAQLQAVRKDRGFGKAGGPSNRSGPSSPSSTGGPIKKRGMCWDCGQQGHWAGDSCCPKPGVGLFKKAGGKGAGSQSQSGSPARRVHLTETFAVEAEHEVPEGHMVHEGPWLRFSSRRLSVRPLSSGMTARSFERQRLPMLVGDTLILVWTSVVEVPSLGLLLGRDFLEGIGGVISFTRTPLRADYLDGKRIPLKQLTAGHLYLEILPAIPLNLPNRRWRRQGVDGVIEVEVSVCEWCRRRAMPAFLEGTAKVIQRYRRLCLRVLGRNMWHFGGLLLWLLQRPSLRYVPLPYGSVRSPVQWKEQAEAMVKNGAWPRRHFRRAVMENLFENLELLKDGAYLRDRLGIRLAFLEDPMLDGMLAAKATKGTKAAIQSQLVSKLKCEAAEKHEKGEAMKAARGAAHFKGGLAATGSASQCRDLFRRDRGQAQAEAPPDDRHTSGHSLGDSSSFFGNPTGSTDGDRATSTRTSGRPDSGQPLARTAGPMEAPPGHHRDEILREVQAMMEQRDNRMESLLAQTMQHVMAVSQAGTHHGEDPLSPDSNMGFGLVEEVIPELHQQVKPGQQLLLRQAWAKYRRDRDLLHVTSQDVREAFEMTAAQDYDTALAEPFVDLAGNWPRRSSPSLGQLLTEEAGRRGHAVTAARRDAEKKKLESEAAVLKAALAHRRQGAFLDELGEADFVMNGRRYVTSSPSFVTALKESNAEDLGELAARALGGIEKQFDRDYVEDPGKVHEGLAAETFKDDDPVSDHGEESEVDEPTQATEEERMIKAIPAAVRQAERRPPKVQRPASLPGPREPGDQVGIDVFDVFDGVGMRFSVLHAVDAATKFKMAVMVEHKSSAEVVSFLRERWAPILMPRTLVADQGREFVSHELENFAGENNMYLHHIAVGAPWQNGLTERTGGILKVLVAAQSLMGADEMKMGLAEGLLAYNMDVGDSGFSPMQAAVGRQPLPPGDALGGGRLGELSATGEATFARLLATRETARMAMLRLHLSRSLRRAEMARSRNPTLTTRPAVGDLVYYYREQKYNRKSSANRRKLLLKKWHGPGLLVALEGASCYVTARGTLTKVALEHVRPASTMERLASGDWAAALDEVVAAANRDQEWEMIPPTDRPASDGSEPAAAEDHGTGLGEQPIPFQNLLVGTLAAMIGQRVIRHLVFYMALDSNNLPFQNLGGGDLPPGEFVKAATGSAAGDSRRPSTLLAPGSPVPESILGPRAGEEHSPVSSDQVPFDAMVMEKSEILAAAQAREGEVHPLVKLQAQAAMDRLSGDVGEAGDHGTWDGRWPLPSRSEYEAFVRAGLKWPTTKDAFAVQAARKEYHWSSMNDPQKAAFREAAEEAWNVWVRNEAVEVLSEDESEKVWATLRQRGELHKVMTPRFVFTDKNDITAYDLRKDAPTASRTSQHLLFTLAASHFGDGWRMGTADVKSAFMKGERYMEGTRELYVKNVEVRNGSPSLPLGRRLSRVLKGVFGLSDAPGVVLEVAQKRFARRLRLANFDHGCRPNPRWLGVLCSHVDDLLFCGGKEAWDSIRRLGEELGFGSLEENTFVYCGKRVTQDLVSGEVTVSMREYHQNLKVIRVPSTRRREVDASLTPGEHKQLRALVGSLQWLVAQVRFDAGFLLSVLQAETPTVGTLLKVNQLIKLFQETGDFELRFRPLDLSNAGILVVTDASLGNVTKTGEIGSKPLERVYSQSCYCVLLAEASLMRGGKGRFTVLDHRSHRLQRVCRSTFAAELLGVEEGADALQYCRGHLAEVLGYDLGHKGVDCILDGIGMVICTDAKDVYDKGNSDTPSYGSQKSLAFTVAWLRGLLSRGNTALKWTATENMFVDCGTKEMDGSHMRKILGSGEWSYKYDADLVKQTVRARAPVQRGPQVLSGTAVGPSDPVLGFLQGLSTEKGWHRKNTTAIQVAHGAKSYRRPEPRFSPKDYPYRTTYALFHDEHGRGAWRLLERDEVYGRMLKPLDRTGAVLISIFKTHKENRTDVKPDAVSEGS